MERFPFLHSLETCAEALRPIGQEAFMKAKLLSLALLTSGALFAQYGGYRSADPYGRSHGRTNPYATGQRIIDSIQSDLSQIGRRAAWDGWARRRFSDSIEHLERFQRSAARGKFDRGRLDKAIDNLNRLLTAPELRPRDRQRIADHRDQLRAFRSRNG